MKNYTPEYREVHLNLMERHPLVQRDMRENHVQRILKDYNPLFINPLVVAHTTTGANRRYWIIDGGHTHEACLRKGVEKLWCKVINVAAYAEIAEIFVGMNKNKLAMSTIDTHSIESDFRADSNSANIDRIFEVNGIRRADVRAYGTIHKVYEELGIEEFQIFAALLSAVKEGGANLDQPTILALSSITKKYHREELADANVIDILTKEFSDIKEEASYTLRGRSLQQSPKALTDALEWELFSRRRIG